MAESGSLNTMTCVKMTPEMAAKLTRLAAETRRSKSAVVRLLVEQAVAGRWRDVRLADDGGSDGR